MKLNNNIDWFTRGIAILGLIVSIVAISLPYIQAHYDSEELLSIEILPEQGNGIIRLSNDINKSRAVQIPYIITLSNIGKVKLSITSYNIQKRAENESIEYFNGLNGGLYSINYKPFSLPKNIDAGESITFRVYLGFLPTDEILNYLHQKYKLNGTLKVSDILLSLAKKGLTIYGGKATYKEFKGGGFHIEIGSEFYKFNPIYNIQFKTGRKNNFIALASEFISQIKR